MPSDARRLAQLLELVLDGTCTDDDRVEFASLLERSPKLCDDVARDVFLHSLLQWQSEDIRHELVADHDSIAAPQPAASLPFTTSKRRTATLRVLAWSAFAASLLMWAAHSYRADSPDATVARIASEVGVVWSQDNSALRPLAGIATGRLRIEAGDLTLEFHNGARLRLNGPASLMVESDMLVHLDRGQATATAPTHLKGFSVNTPAVNVVDQGTEFGVAVRDNGSTDVVVFEGKVDLEDSFGSQSLSRRLQRGEAARVDRQGDLQRIMQVGRSIQGGWWTDDATSHADDEAGRSVIRLVRDNVPPSDNSKYFCYQIAYGALRDDAPAYADRHPHEWNGLTATGLPPMLVGADYVRTFNDYRYKNDFELTVELAKPANLYVLFDDRVPSPTWLLSQFVDTGFDIGLDEGPYEGMPSHVHPATATGAGKSIDN
ncbi:MAG: FecR domain-containing protein, partial [Planctomycetales bacterium]|nr:FecR domain-containing protein [Planctomycetales bacterium]